MAKGLNLIDTNILEVHMARTNGDMHIRARHVLIDDHSAAVAQDTYEVDFSKMPTDLRAAANNFMKALSKELNNKAVAENKDSWVNI